MEAKKILESLVKDKSLIREHKNWGPYIRVPFEEIKMIGLIEQEGYYELSFYFGASQIQSRSFYKGKPQIKQLETTKWILRPDFHLSNPLQNLIWFQSDLSPEQYISFWQQNTNLLYQHTKEDILPFLKSLSKKEVIVFDKQKQHEFESSVLSKDYSRFNICASFGVIYPISKEHIADLIAKNNLNAFLNDKIAEGLKVINENGHEFLKNYQNLKKGDWDDGSDNNWNIESALPDMVDPDGL